VYLRQHDIVDAQRGGRGYVDGFLAMGSEVERDPALPLSFVEDGAHDLEGHHVAVHFQGHLLTHLTKVSTVLRHGEVVFFFKEKLIQSIYGN
jgi:hypothetical protein